MDDVVVSTKDDCQMECFNNAQCNWYSYDFDFGYCQLTKDCIPRNSTTPNVYGQKNCYSDNGQGSSSKMHRNYHNSYDVFCLTKNFKQI